MKDMDLLTPVRVTPKIERMVGELVCMGLSREEALGFLNKHAKVLAAKPSRRRTDPDAIVAQAKPILIQFRQLYVDKHGREPQVYGHDYITIQKLLKDYGPQVVSAQLNAFFAWDDPYIERTGRSIALFYRQWNQITAAITAKAPVVRRPSNCTHTPLCRDAQEHTRKFLADQKLSSDEMISSPLTTSI